MKKSLLLITLAATTIALSGCSNEPGYDSIEVPSPSATASPSESAGGSDTVDIGQGGGSITIDLPDFNDAGEEGTPSIEAWKEFATIADNSKFRILNEGGYEYFGMYDESYFMLYDPKFPGGENWVVYYLESDQTVQIGYDVFEMAAYNAGIELFIYGSTEDRALSGSEVSKNPDGSYTVSVKELGYKLRYNVEDGYIIGRAVWDESSDTFMGYTNISYGLSENDKATVARAYALAIEAGEEFKAPAEDKFLTDYSKGSALTGLQERSN
jgi:hypothetical protein